MSKSQHLFWLWLFTALGFVMMTFAVGNFVFGRPIMGIIDVILTVVNAGMARYHYRRLG